MPENRIGEFLPGGRKANTDFEHSIFSGGPSYACSPGAVQTEVVDGWEEAAKSLFRRVAASIAEKATLALKLRELECRVAKLELHDDPKFPEIYSTFIATLGISDFELRKTIPVTIRKNGEDFLVSFLDANISTGGKILQEAISDLQSLIVDSFKSLELSPEGTLGPAMTRRKNVLLETVCRIS